MFFASVGISLCSPECHAAPETEATHLAPTIEFVYPHSSDVVTDYPIFIETRVTNCTLEPPVQYWSAVPRADAAVGHIHYTLDNTPIFATKSTQVVIAKPAGKSLPVGKHILKAELVSINHEPRNPRVFAEIQIICERAQTKRTSASSNGVVPMDERTRSELQLVEKQLMEVQQQLKELKSQPHEVPNP